MDKLLASLQAIHPLSPELLTYLETHVKYREVSKGAYLLKAGHTSQDIYFVEEGLLRCYYLKGDRDISSWFMREGSMVVSIESFYSRRPSHEYIQALEPCRVYHIRHEELFHVYRTYPEFNFIARELLQQYHIQWARQLYSLRRQTGIERYRWMEVNEPELILRVQIKHLASYLNVTENYLSAIRLKAMTAK